LGRDSRPIAGASSARSPACRSRTERRRSDERLLHFIERRAALDRLDLRAFHEHREIEAAGTATPSTTACSSRTGPARSFARAVEAELTYAAAPRRARARRRLGARARPLRRLIAARCISARHADRLAHARARPRGEHTRRGVSPTSLAQTAGRCSGATRPFRLAGRSRSCARFGLYGARESCGRACAAAHAAGRRRRRVRLPLLAMLVKARRSSVERSATLDEVQEAFIERAASSAASARRASADDAPALAENPDPRRRHRHYLSGICRCAPTPIIEAVKLAARRESGLAGIRDGARTTNTCADDSSASKNSFTLSNQPLARGWRALSCWLMASNSRRIGAGAREVDRRPPTGRRGRPVLAAHALSPSRAGGTSARSGVSAGSGSSPSVERRDEISPPTRALLMGDRHLAMQVVVSRVKTWVRLVAPARRGPGGPPFTPAASPERRTAPS